MYVRMYLCVYVHMYTCVYTCIHDMSSSPNTLQLILRRIKLDGSKVCRTIRTPGIPPKPYTLNPETRNPQP